MSDDARQALEAAKSLMMASGGWTNPAGYQTDAALWIDRAIANLSQAPAMSDNKLIEALGTASAWFEDYRRQHAAKGTSDGDAKAQVNAERAAFCLAALASSPTPGGGDKSWRCFQCDEVFTDEACARLHFGEYQACDPICKVGAERYRDLENQLAEFRSESDAATKEFYALGARHTQERMREEERGYERGLADGQALAAEYGPAAPVAPTGGGEGVVERLAEHFEALAKPELNRDLPKGTRDERCRRAGMVEAFTIAAQRCRSALSHREGG